MFGRPGRICPAGGSVVDRGLPLEETSLPLAHAPRGGRLRLLRRLRRRRRAAAAAVRPARPRRPRRRPGRGLPDQVPRPDRSPGHGPGHRPGGGGRERRAVPGGRPGGPGHRAPPDRPRPLPAGSGARPGHARAVASRAGPRRGRPQAARGPGPERAPLRRGAEPVALRQHPPHRLGRGVEGRARDRPAEPAALRGAPAARRGDQHPDGGHRPVRPGGNGAGHDRGLEPPAPSLQGVGGRVAPGDGRGQRDLPGGPPRPSRLHRADLPRRAGSPTPPPGRSRCSAGSTTRAS